MENLKTEAAKASQDRIKQRRIYAEEQAEKDAENARQVLHDLLKTRLGRDVDTSQSEVSPVGDDVHSMALMRIDNIRLAAFPQGNALIGTEADQRLDSDVPVVGYTLIALHQCRCCEEVLMAEIGELADLGDFLGSDLLCPNCSENA